MKPNIQRTKKDVREIKENLINLTEYPPKLRKVAKYMLMNLGSKETMKSICQNLDLKYHSVIQMIYEEKARGRDLMGFISAVADGYLNSNLIAVDVATLDGALTGTARDREIYYKRTDKLHERTEIQINTNLSLTYAIQVIQGANEDPREKGENSLTPYIPPNEET
jgi:hypothetical protein